MVRHMMRHIWIRRMHVLIAQVCLGILPIRVINNMVSYWRHISCVLEQCMDPDCRIVILIFMEILSWNDLHF